MTRLTTNDMMKEKDNDRKQLADYLKEHKISGLTAKPGSSAGDILFDLKAMEKAFKEGKCTDVTKEWKTF